MIWLTLVIYIGENYIYKIVGEATNTNFSVFGLARPGLELTIYRTRIEHATHYTTDGYLELFERCL